MAEHLAMRRRVAVKLLPEAVAQAPSALARFQREAAALATLDHPNVVRAFDCDEYPGGYFLVMEYAEGTDLYRYVQANGPLSPDRAATLVAQAAAGLHHAHTCGWVHRDVKPSNLFLDTDGRVKVLDLGLARLLGGEDGQVTALLDGGAVMGTLDYMAPEQSLDSSAVDHRADVYGLGATFFFLLTGRPPFPDGGLAQKLLAHQFRDPPPVRSLRPDVPEETAALIQGMMAKNPADRPQSLAEVVTRLAAGPPAAGGPAPAAGAPGANPAVRPGNVQADPPSSPTCPAVRPRSPGVPWVAIAAALSLAAVSVAALVYAFQPRPDRSGPQQPASEVSADNSRGLRPTTGGLTPVTDAGAPNPPRDRAVTVQASPAEVVVGIDSRPVVTLSAGTMLGDRFAFLRVTPPSAEAPPLPATISLGLDVVTRHDSPFINYRIRPAGPAERLQFADGAGFRQSFGYVGRGKEGALGIAETWSVRVAPDGGGVLLLLTTETKADAPGYSVPLRANALRLRLASGASAGGWSYQYGPNGEVRKDERFFGVPGKTLVAWVADGARRRGAVLVQHPRNRLPTKFGVTLEKDAAALQGHFARSGPADPGLPAHTFDPADGLLRLSYGVYLFDTADGLPDPAAVHARYVRLAGE